MAAPPAPRTRLSASDRRDQLLEVTARLVVERGFQGVSIEAVAKEAGITRPVVYGHFGGLNGLLEAMIDREHARTMAQLAAVLPADPADAEPQAALDAAIRGYLEAVRADPGTWRLALLPPEGAPALLRDQITAGRDEVVATLAEVVGRGRGASPDPALSARTVVAIADESARLLLTDPDEYPIERLVAHATWMLDRLWSSTLA
jgi:AcrR family transcriptional regulator